MEKLTREKLYSLEQYSEKRAEFRNRVLEHKKNRQVSVGEHAFHDTVNRIAAQIRIEDVIPQRSEIQRRIERAGSPNGALPVLVRMNANITVCGSVKYR